MSGSTLTNFGVPLGGGAGRGGILMPKVKNRFRVTANNFGAPVSTVLTQQVITVARPNMNFNPQTVHSFNSIAYYAGKMEFEAISMTVRDDITNNVSTLVGSQVQKQMNIFAQTVPAAASDYKFTMLIDTMDGGDDTVLEEWYFEGCFLASVNYESFDYSSSDAMTIELSIRFDNATQTGGVLMPQSPIFSLTDGSYV